MCQKLLGLIGKTPEEILKISKQTDEIPIKLEKVVEAIGVYRQPTTFDDIEKFEKRKVVGLVLVSGDNVGIFYDKDATLEEKRFIIAREIGHCCLHGDALIAGYVEFLHNNGYKDEHEKEASEFAAKLLIPEHSLISVYNRLILPSIDGLSEIFEVPKNLMIFRLKSLRLNYYIDEKDLLVKPK